MTRRIRVFTGLAVGIVLSLALTVQLGAQDKKAAKPAKMITYQGSVKMIDKTKSTIDVRTGTLERNIMYNADTKFMYGHSKDNKPGSADAVKEGFYISCAGATEAGKPLLVAKECVYRETK